ncbi:MAG: hypothetical protein ACE5IH_04805 [Thermodesulfobacteriota bacterium]
MKRENFKVLEERVGSLLKEYVELKKEKERLEGELKKEMLESLELSRQVEKLNRERGLVKEKVKHLLKKVGGLTVPV